MKFENNTAARTGLLFLLMLREGHTRSPRPHVQKLLVHPWEGKSWSKKIVQLNKVTVAQKSALSSLRPLRSVRIMTRSESRALQSLSTA
jgi:hypothetical protein